MKEQRKAIIIMTVGYRETNGKYIQICTEQRIYGPLLYLLRSF